MKWHLLAGAVALVAAKKANGAVSHSKVIHRERTGTLLKPLEDFLDWWEVDGPHSIVIPVYGGTREGAEAALWQREQFNGGATRAATLIETPHGRRTGLDFYPGRMTVGKGTDEFDYYLPWERQPKGVIEKFRLQANLAKQFGFEVGADWGWDYPHIQIPNWRSYPYPAVQS